MYSERKRCFPVNMIEIHMHFRNPTYDIVLNIDLFHITKEIFTSNYFRDNVFPPTCHSTRECNKQCCLCIWMAQSLQNTCPVLEHSLQVTRWSGFFWQMIQSRPSCGQMESSKDVLRSFFTFSQASFSCIL